MIRLSRENAHLKIRQSTGFSGDYTGVKLASLLLIGLLIQDLVYDAT